MKWMEVNTIEELKSCGKLKDIRQDIKLLLGDKHSITGRGYADILKRILEFREIAKLFVNQDALVSETAQVIDVTLTPLSSNQEITDQIFVSKASEYIFYLTALDGNTRMNYLKIEDKHFTSKKEAKKWRDEISKIIHPDLCHQKEATQAMSELNMLYQLMIGRG